MKSRRRPTEYIEGPEAAERFDRALVHVLTVSKSEMNKREAAYQQARSTKDRPGPRPKRAK
jgi:hypothetical protein